MGYWQDVLDVFLLKDKTYKKLANDKGTFKRYFSAYLLSSYLVFLFFAIVGGLAALVMFPGTIAFSPEKILLILLLAIGFIIIIPFIIFIIAFILTLVPYIIGLVFGGRPRNYVDFFKIIHFTTPVQIPICALFNQVANPIFSVWHFFIMFKTYKVVHKLNSTQAMWAVIVYIIIILFVLMVVVLLFLSIYSNFLPYMTNPGMFA